MTGKASLRNGCSSWQKGLSPWEDLGKGILGRGGSKCKGSVVRPTFLPSVCALHCNVHGCVRAHVRLFVTPGTATPPGSSVREILQARVLESAAISSFRFFSCQHHFPQFWVQVTKKEQKMKWLIYWFYFWLHWVFTVARRLSLVAASGATLQLQHTGFSLLWLLLLQSVDSRAQTQ